MDSTALEGSHQAEGPEDSASQTRTRFAGELGDVSVADLFQTLEMSKKGGLLVVETDVGDGTVWFSGGKIIDAELGGLVGEAAVYRLLMSGRGTFEVKFKAPRRNPRMEMAPQGLLMEGIRRLDDWNRFAKGLPPPGARLALHTQHFEAWREDLAPNDVDLLERFDGERPLLEIVEANANKREEALEAVVRLHAKGLLKRLDPEGQSGWRRSTRIEAIDDFWTREFALYLHEHRHPLNRLTHMIGIPILVVTLVYALATLDWRWFVGGQLIGWALQIVGHIVEGNRPALLKRPSAFLMGPLMVMVEMVERLGVRFGFAERARAALPAE